MKISRSASINVAFYAIISLNPYFRWLLPNEIFYFFFLISTVFLTFQLKDKFNNAIISNTYRRRVALMLLIYLLYFTTSFIHEMRWGHFVWLMPLILITFYNTEIITRGYIYIKIIFIWISIFSILIWMLNQINFPIPYYTYQPDFRYFTSDYYRIYGPAISLYRGDLPVGGIYGIERITGIFAEPGHFGIYLGFILAIEKFNFSIRDNQILLLVGILTFSTAFYGMLLLGFIYRVINERKISNSAVKTILLIGLTLGLGFALGGDGFKQLIYGRVINSQDNDSFSLVEVVESRASNRLVEDFVDFSKSKDFIIGMGYTDHTEIEKTNWRGLIYRFGIVGFVIIILMFLIIINKVPKTYGLLLLSFGVLVLSHRSYFLYTPSIFTLLTIACIIYDKYKVKPLVVTF